MITYGTHDQFPVNVVPVSVCKRSEPAIPRSTAPNPSSSAPSNPKTTYRPSCLSGTTVSCLKYSTTRSRSSTTSCAIGGVRPGGGRLGRESRSRCRSRRKTLPGTCGRRGRARERAHRRGGASGNAAMIAATSSRKPIPSASVNPPDARKANRSGRPTSRRPLSAVTPMSEPVLPRSLPSSGVPSNRGRSVPVSPATARPSQSACELGPLAEVEGGDQLVARRLVAAVQAGAVHHREPRGRDAELGRASPRSPGCPRPSCPRCSPSDRSRVTTARRSGCRSSGADRRRCRAGAATAPRPIGAASAGAAECPGLPPTCTPRSSSSRSSSSAAKSAGSSTGTGSGFRAQNPSLTVSAPSGPTWPSVR